MTQRCKYLGRHTGESRAAGRVHLDLFDCARHGRCTLGTPLPQVACCRDCRDYSGVPLGGPGLGGQPPLADVEHPSILLTGGIGDAIAVESLLPPDLRAELRTVFYACPASREVSALFKALPYPRLRSHVVLRTGATTYLDRGQVERGIPLPPQLQDWSIGAIFGGGVFNSSSFALHRLAAPALPPRPYVAIVSRSTWGHWEGRSFTDADWATALAFLDQRGLHGVLLCREPTDAPAHPRLVNLAGQRTILESAELLKRADGYLGIDSCLSVLAAKVFPPERLAIKTVSRHCRYWRAVYFAPHVRFDFLQPTLREPQWD